MLLVYYARGSRLLKVVRRRTLLGVVGVMLLVKMSVRAADIDAIATAVTV